MLDREQVNPQKLSKAEYGAMKKRNDLSTSSEVATGVWFLYLVCVRK